MINMKAYIDANGEIVYVQDGSFQDLDSIAGGLTRVPALDYTVSADLLTNVVLDGIQTDVSTNTGNISTNASGIATNTGDIATNTADIATNVSAISANAGLIATNSSDIAELELNQADLIALSGVAENSTNLGSFPGTIVTDNVNIKTAIQELEAFAEGISNTIRVTDVSVVADIPTRDALSPDEGDVAKVLDADGNGNPQTYIYDGTAWISLKSDDLVDSVNGQIGNVVLDTDDIAEGPTNLYHTVARARAAAVVNSLAGTETDQAPSVAAVNAALAAQDDASEIDYDNTASGLTATNVQDAVDEVDSRIDALEVSTVKEYVYANQTVAQTNINGTAVSLVFDNEAKQSSGAVFAVNTTTGEITVNKTGTFKVEYILTADTNDGSRRTSETTLEINTGAGFAALSASLGSTTAYGYHRNNASGENSAAAQAILDLTSGDILRLRVRRSNGNGSINTIPQGTSISIEEK